ncbi:hypothetical protein [Demequina globuliformis]|uniref:hypothetical protein n=1 Tax=Demequina globuliformis TaxID=676202 RepID=UPI0007836960|nr:hypothetical protein [Demequina globuliformis]
MASLTTDGRLQAPELAALKNTSTLTVLFAVWVGGQIALAGFVGGYYGGLVTDPFASFPFSFAGMLGGLIVGAFAVLPVYAIYKVVEKVLHTLHAQFEAKVLIDNWRSRRPQPGDAQAGTD